MLEQEYNQARIQLLKTRIERIKLENKEKNEVNEIMAQKLLEVRSEIKRKETLNNKLMFENKLKIEGMQELIAKRDAVKEQYNKGRQKLLDKCEIIDRVENEIKSTYHSMFDIKNKINTTNKRLQKHVAFQKYLRNEVQELKGNIRVF
jgi:uncharacterized protein (DUF885 family)